MLVGSHHPWSHNARHQCCLKSPLQSLPHWRMASSSLRTSDHPPSPPAGIYQAINEHFVVRADVLQAGGKRGNNTRIWVSLIRAKLKRRGDFSRKLQPLWGLSSLQWSVIIKSGPRKGRWWNGKGHGQRRLIDAHEDQSFGQEIWSNRPATVAQTAREAKAASDRKVSGYTCNLLGLGLHSCSQRGQVTPVHSRRFQQCKHQI